MALGGGEAGAKFSYERGAAREVRDRRRELCGAGDRCGGRDGLLDRPGEFGVGLQDPLLEPGEFGGGVDAELVGEQPAASAYTASASACRPLR